MSKTLLEALEIEVNDLLKKMAADDSKDIFPITDGVVDIDSFLSNSPRMLWILKEPWENGGFGDWSLTKKLIPDLIANNQIRGNPTYRKMAYVTYSVFNEFMEYSKIKYPDEDSQVRESLNKIAYINISKMPGKSVSNSALIAECYRRNRDILKKQVATINPDVVIAGNIMPLFFKDFGLEQRDFEPAGSVDFCQRNGRLYVNAYHPAYWKCKEERYVNDLVAVIKNHSPVLPPPKPSIANFV